MGIKALARLFLFSLIFTLCNTSSAAEQLTRQQLDNIITQGLANGKDISALTAEFKKRFELNKTSSRYQTNKTSKHLHQALKGFNAALKPLIEHKNTNPKQIENFLASYDQLHAAKLLFDEQSKRDGAMLSDVDSLISNRHQKEIDRINKVLLPIANLIEKSRNQLTELSKSINPNKLPQYNEWKAALSTLSPLIRIPAAEPLRSTTLPYRRSGSLSRSPVKTPSIIPSYQDTSDSTIPNNEDIANSADAPLSPDILSQAKSLQYDYVKIFEFVQNEIDVEWYSGGMKGAEATLIQKSGNDIDQASLLLALLRASGVAGRYVHGTIELPVEIIADSLGITETTHVPDIMQKAGIAYQPIIRGGKVSAIELEYTWVSAQLPYNNYRGAVVDASGMTWIPLAPAIKKYTLTPAAGLFSNAELNAQEIKNNQLARPQVESPVDNIKKEILSYLQKTAPDSNYIDQLGSKKIVPQNLGLLPSTLPFKVIAVTSESGVLAKEQQHQIRFVIRNGSHSNSQISLDQTFPVSSLVGNRVTLSYQPATIDDHNTVNQFAGLDGVPAYLIKLRPQIRIGGLQLAVGQEPINMGEPHIFEIHLISPLGEEQFSRKVTAGSYHAISIQAQKAYSSLPTDKSDDEYLGAKLLGQAAAGYQYAWTQAETELAAQMDVTIIRPLPSIAIVSNLSTVDTVLGRPQKLNWQGVTLDAAVRIIEPYSNDNDLEKQWMQISALQGSFLEHQWFEDNFLVTSVSSDKLISIAASTGNPLLTITASNFESKKSQLNHSAGIIEIIEDEIHQGHEVTIPTNTINHIDWQGAAWIVDDPSTGGSGYYIAGALAGGSTAQTPDDWALQILADAFKTPYTAQPNTNPDEAAWLHKLPHSEAQVTQVGEITDLPLAVIVRDKHGFPVKNAIVKFSVKRGDGELLTPKGDFVSQIDITTNSLGVASLSFKAGKYTKSNPLYIKRSPADAYATIASQNIVRVSLPDSSPSDTSKIVPRDFSIIAFPKQINSLITTNNPATSGTVSSWSSNITLQPQDEYGNPLSNIPVSFSVDQPTQLCAGETTNFQNAKLFRQPLSTSGCPSFPTLEECGSSSITEFSNTNGISVGVLLGNTRSTQYNIVASAPGVSSKSFNIITEGACDKGSILLIGNSSPVDKYGNNLRAVKISSQLPEPIPVSVSYTVPDYEVKISDGDYYLEYKPDIKRIVKTTATLEVDITNSGFASSIAYAGDHYNIYANTSANIGKYEATITIKNANWVIDKVNPDTGEVYQEVNLHAPIAVQTSFFGVNPLITGIDVENSEQNIITLSNLNETEQGAQINYKIDPDSYISGMADIDIFVDDAWNSWTPGSSKQGDGSVYLSPGRAIDVNKKHEAELVLNRGSTYEVKSERVTIPITQNIFRYTTPSIEINRTVDLVNDKTCSKSSQIDFKTSQDANIDISLSPLDTRGEPTNSGIIDLVKDEYYAKGSHSIRISPWDLPVGDYQITYKGISAVDAHKDEEIGSATSRLQTTESLPIGHVRVKGVDLLDGQLGISRQDVVIPGRGPSLNFSRNYSSSAHPNLGPLGVGWTHNYQSSLRLGPCGDIVIQAADGGSMRFNDNGDGTYSPLNGYHSTLIKDLKTDSYNLYTTSGTRYHFAKIFNEDYQIDFIEDTNGNALRFAYNPGSTEHELITVESDSGRSFSFEYEYRSFIPKGGKVITKVTGPAGIEINFDYDTYGNLKSSSREGEVKGEQYNYHQNLDVKWRHKLVDSINPLGGTTTYAYKESDLYISMGPKGVSTIAPFVFVETIQEPSEASKTNFIYDFAALAGSRDEIEVLVTDELSHATRYMLNKYGAPTTVDDPRPGSTTISWYPKDKLKKSQTDGRGIKTDYEYDEWGNKTKETTTGSDSCFTAYSYFTNLGYIRNRPKTVQDCNENTATLIYDSAGNLTKTINAEDEIVTYDYLMNGDRNWVKNPRGFFTFYEYNTYGNISSIKQATGDTKAVSYTETITEYDGRSRPIDVYEKISSGSPGIRHTNFEYNSRFLDQVAKQTIYITSVKPAYSQIETINTYDNAGNKLTETTSGRFNEWEYDAQSRITNIYDAKRKVSHIEYDNAGNKTLVRNRRNIETTYIYDDANDLITIQEPLGKNTSYGYDEVGNIISMKNPRGFTFTYGYDMFNNQTSIVDPLDGVTETRFDYEGNKVYYKEPRTEATTFEYDKVNRLRYTRQPLGITTEFQYDEAGNSTFIIGPALDMDNAAPTEFTYGAGNRVSTKIDREGNPTWYQYNLIGNLEREINARLNAVSYKYNVLGRKIESRIIDNDTDIVTTFSYDEFGNLRYENQPNGNTIERTYDVLNQLETVTDNLGSVAQYGYNANGNKLYQIDSFGNRTDYSYDDLDRLDTVNMPENRYLDYGYDLNGNKTSEENSQGYITSFTYDKIDRWITTTDPAPFDTQSIVHTYHPTLNQETETDRRGNTTTFFYDDLNRLIKVKSPALSNGDGNHITTTTYNPTGTKETVTNYRDIVTEYKYDKENRLTHSYRDGVLINEISYDKVGNKLYEWDTKRNVTGYEYNKRNLPIFINAEENSITQINYDSMGNTAYTKDPDSRITESVYDVRNRIKAITLNDEVTTTDYLTTPERIVVTNNRDHSWTNIFDGARRLTDTQGPDGVVSHYEYDIVDNKKVQRLGLKNTMTYDYDELNRLTHTHYPDSKFEYRTYDKNSNLSTLIDAKGQLFEYDYDELNRETERRYPLPEVPTGDDLVKITSQYDVDSFGSGITRKDQVVEHYSGATATRATTKTYDTFDRLNQSIDGFNKTIKYTYDLNGNRQTMTDPDNSVTRYTYDKLNRLNTVTAPGGVTNYDYYQSGLKRKIKYPNGTTTDYTYDGTGRVETIINNQNSSLVSSFEYGYTDETGKRSNNRTLQIENNGSGEEITTYLYDAADRLQSITYPDKATTYTYDEASNRTSEVALTIPGSAVSVDKTHVYTSKNQLDYITDNLDSANSVDYTYDDNGNQILKTKGATTTTFIYGVRDKLQEIFESGQSQGWYGYDYAGMRVTKQTGDNTTHYTYDDSSVLIQFDGAGDTTAKYEYGPDQLLSMDHHTDGRQFYLFDALGSVVNLTTDAGAIKTRYQYDAWGNPRNTVGSSENIFGFTGHEKDTETGLYYFKARFYDPDTGRFITQDPYLGDINTPPSLHRYLYAYSSPMVYVDLDGYSVTWTEQQFTKIERYNGKNSTHLTTNDEALLKGMKSLGFKSDASKLSRSGYSHIPTSVMEQLKKYVANIRQSRTKGVSQAVIIKESADTEIDIKLELYEWVGAVGEYFSQDHHDDLMSQMMGLAENDFMDISLPRAVVETKTDLNANNQAIGREIQEVQAKQARLMLEFKKPLSQKRTYELGHIAKSYDIKLAFLHSINSPLSMLLRALDSNANPNTRVVAGVSVGLEAVGAFQSIKGIRAGVAARRAGIQAMDRGMSFGDYARQATKNANSRTLVLGKHDAARFGGQPYNVVARNTKSTYFQLDNWDEISSKLGGDVWGINKEFLNQQWKQGKEILFSHNPWEASKLGGPNNYFEKEVLHLIDLGAKDFVKTESGLWKLVK